MEWTFSQTIGRPSVNGVNTPMSRRALLLFCAMGLIWGMPYLFIRAAVAEVSPGVLVFVRTALGAAVLLPLAFRRGRLAALRGPWRALVLFAAVEIVVPWFLLSDAEQRLPSALTGMLVSATPMLAVVAARVTGIDRRVGGPRLLGLAVGAAGLVALGGGAVDAADPWAVVEVVLAATCYAAAPIIVTRRLADVPPLTLTAGALSVSALLCAAPAALTWPSQVPSTAALGSILVLATVCTAAAFVLFLSLITEIGPARATAITYVNPVVAVALGAVVLGESLTWPTALAGVVVLLGTVLVTRPTRARRRELVTA